MMPSEFAGLTTASTGNVQISALRDVNLHRGGR